MASPASNDLTNAVLSLGQDRYWRRALGRRCGSGPAKRSLDLAAGTATVSTVETHKSGAWCVACRFSVGMLAGAARLRFPKVASDATRLPFW